jgi:hydroxyacylglutathione hydrolase
MPAWTAAGYPVARTPQITALELARRLEEGDDLRVLDVRGNDEFAAGHIGAARHIMAGYLPERLDQVPNGDTEVAIVCRSGYRSSVAASVLERAGFRGVMNVSGGMNAWRSAGLPVETKVTA